VKGDSVKANFNRCRKNDFIKTVPRNAHISIPDNPDPDSNVIEEIGPHQ
jgi:hypothetical protein